MTTNTETPAAPPVPAEAPEPAVPSVPVRPDDRIDHRSKDDGYEREMSLLEQLIPDETDAPAEADPGDEADEAPKADELPAEDEPVAEEDSEEEPQPEASDDVPDELEDAYSALQADGWRLAELKALSKANLIRMGKAAAKRQSDVKAKFDKFSAEIGELKQKASTAKDKSEAEPGGESPSQPAGVNLAALTKQFSQVTGLDEGEAEPLLAQLQTTFTGPLSKELARANETIDTMGSILGDLVFEEVRKAKVETYPDLASKQGVEALQAKLKRLDRSAYSDLPFRDRIEAMVEDAAGLAFRGKAEAPEPPRKKRAPTNRQPSLPGQTPATHGMSHEAREMATLEAIERKYGLMS